MPRHRPIAMAAAVVVAATLTGCSGGGSSFVPKASGGSNASGGSSASGAPSTSAVLKGVAPGTDAPSSTAPTSTAPTSTAAPSPRTTRPLGLRDFRDVSYTVPSGFRESTDYSPLTPLESSFTSHYLVPTDSTNVKEVIGMHVYTLPAAKTVTAATDAIARIKAYNAKSKAVVRGSITKAAVTIDGLPAYTDTATEPVDYTYVAYWAFGTHHVLQFACQLGSSSSVSSLAVACGTTLASLRLN